MGIHRALMSSVVSKAIVTLRDMEKHSVVTFQQQGVKRQVDLCEFKGSLVYKCQLCIRN